MESTENIGQSSSFPPLSRGIVALCLLISLAGIGNHDLWTPDEPREAAIALSMSRTGDFVIPRLAGQAFVEKPPLYYIVASTAISLAGPWLGNTAALRLTSALWGLGTLGMTYLLARRLFHPPQQALLAMLVLATMPGFVHISHWILVDNALMFFVVAAMWSLAEAYLGHRGGFLPLAGLFAAGAFLTKGPIGPVVIALGWIGLVIPWLRRGGLYHGSTLRWLLFHAAAFLILATLSFWWMMALRERGGPDLWNEWFWTNQFGRFTGRAKQLGHLRGGFYYLEVLPLYVLPWIVALIMGAGWMIARLWRREPLLPSYQLLLWWGLGGLFLLSLFSTKREIYLSVLLPAFALMSVPALQEPVHAWIRKALKMWMGLVLMAMVLLIPALVLSLARGRMPPLEGGGYLALALTMLGLVVAVMIKRHLPLLHRGLAVTALGYMACLTVLCPMIDRVKSYGPAFRDMAARVQKDPESRVAGWNFDETTRAGFYYYCDLVFPSVSNIVELQSILKGSQSRFNGVIIVAKRFPPSGVSLPAWKVVWETPMGPHRRLIWIAGDRSPKPYSSKGD